MHLSHPFGAGLLTPPIIRPQVSRMFLGIACWDIVPEPHGRPPVGACGSDHRSSRRCPRPATTLSR